MKIPLYLKILIGMALGLVLGLVAVRFGFINFVIFYIKPFGTIFFNALKLIAIPLIFVSLIKGITDLTDISKLSFMGWRTIAMYLATTVIAITIGLVCVNTIEPGSSFPNELRQELLGTQQNTVELKLQDAKGSKEHGPLHFITEMVPDNIFSAASSNRNMLQIIVFAILFGIAMVLLPAKKTQAVKSFFDGLNDIILKIIDIIMLYAPIGVFALFASVIVEIAGNNPKHTLHLLSGLGLYALVVVVGLLIMIFIIYPLILKSFYKIGYFEFFKSIFSAQLMAFSTSSSAATLPVTFDCCEKKLGIKKKVTGFVLPIGATINMDGTSLYQAVAAVFIAQAMGVELSFMQQLTIVVTATLASIGSAAVPSAGIIMLIIVLEAIGVPSEGVGLILAIDRPLDMLRTSVNVTGDCTVATVINTVQEKES